MIKHLVGDMRGNAEVCHPCDDRSPQIMQYPVLYTGKLVQLLLGLTKIAKRARLLGSKNVADPVRCCFEHALCVGR